MGITFDNIMLFLLGIFSVRQLIAQNIDIPLPKKLRWLIYDKKDATQPVLCRRAYNMQHMVQQKQSNNTIIEKILEMDTHHIKYYEDGLYHGRNTVVESKYFINTLEASYNEEDLSTMTSAIYELIVSSKLPFSQIDFVLYLKSGNQILARNIYKDVAKDMIYVCIQDGNSSRYPVRTTVPAHMFSVKYENWEALLREAEGSRNQKLNGIVIDCSVSTGEGLKSAIHEFNELIVRKSLNINKIEHAYVLYAHKPYKDEECKDFKLHRYFDMDEKVRELIYNVYQGNKSCIEVYNYLKKNKLLYVD